ncbi:tRNA uridine(34) 5-carboxymethylaminomethyl modification radical SAM/GNAT enzyme Elp3 [Candidatus Woesearchaeota archaeon]|nr:tRNA uridine(34) 5-carboxymethylaminomethyl modification radical SAM/GNAT enzyme Elp3 [Candidatus Woesearchaeota archaeon]
MELYQEIISVLRKKKLTAKQLARLKRELSMKYKAKKIPTNIEILLHSEGKDLSWLKKRLMTKPTRTISGVAPVAIMTKPFKCPHGKCAMCPGGVKSPFGDVPQSYTGREPATMRGIRNKYSSYLQIFNRLEQYILLGHNVDKVELILMGGTFPSFPIKYQEEFVWGAFKAMNDFSKLFFVKEKLNWSKFKRFFELPVEDLEDKKRINRIQKKLLKLKGKFSKAGLLKEQTKNEKAKIRGVALCIETRPDYCTEKEIKRMLRLGCTRIELGVQHLNDKVLDKITRGHDTAETVKATKLAKDHFLKVGYHIMPGLPGSSIGEDKKMFKELFSDSRFRPDALKIYPCMVTKGTKLYDLWARGKYKPLDTERAAKLIAWFKEQIPEYVRVLRVQRDIPTYQIMAGVSMTNLRQYIHEKFKPSCRCIRCREPKGKEVSFKDVKIKVQQYRASTGEEFFISAEDTKNDLLLGFCRLRITGGLAGIRELHVYGMAAGVGEKGSVQHKGWGKKLMGTAEEIVLREGIKKVTVISGIGVRGYYRKLGYVKEGTYMVKFFK